MERAPNEKGGNMNVRRVRTETADVGKGVPYQCAMISTPRQAVVKSAFVVTGEGDSQLSIAYVYECGGGA